MFLSSLIMLYNKFVKRLNVYFWVVDILGKLLRICSLCTDPPAPPPPPLPLGKIGEGPLLRFFLRGGGLCTQAKNVKNSLLVTFFFWRIPSILWFHIWPEVIPCFWLDGKKTPAWFYTYKGKLDASGLYTSAQNELKPRTLPKSIVKPFLSSGLS